MYKDDEVVSNAYEKSKRSILLVSLIRELSSVNANRYR